MTEASKARKRHPMRIVHGAPMDPERRSAVLRALSEMRTTIVLPKGAEIEIVQPRIRRKPTVTLTGIATAAGVGGRRHRKRRRALDRRG